MKVPTQICRGFTDEQCRELRKRLVAPNGQVSSDEAAWNCAVDVFQRRITERFLSCIDALEEADSLSDIAVSQGAPPDCSTLPQDDGRRVVVPGFAIMALSCILVETLQLFREGLPELFPVTNLYKRFLKLGAFGGEFKDDQIVENFVYRVRNGIMHEAGTRRWVIRRGSPQGLILEPRGSGYVLNRTAFYEALKKEFRNYLQQLRAPGSVDLRRNFIKKMDDVLKKI